MRDKWPWDWEIYRFWLWIPSIVALVLTIGFYPRFGWYSLFFLVISLWGLLFILVYSIVGKKVKTLKASLSQEEGEMVEGLTVNGIMQSPGIVIFKEKELVMVPIVGSRVEIPVYQIKAVHESRWFNGKKLWWKRGYMLEVMGRSRIGFAVPRRAGEGWFSNHKSLR